MQVFGGRIEAAELDHRSQGSQLAGVEVVEHISDSKVEAKS